MSSLIIIKYPLKGLLCIACIIVGCMFLHVSLSAQKVLDKPDSQVALSETPTSTRVIEYGDLLQITIKEDAQFQFEGKVSEDGLINLPYLGERLVAGQSLQSLQRELANSLEEDLYWKATVVIRVLEQAPAAIYVFGAVKEPGLVDLPPTGQISMSQVLARVKGLTSWADLDNAYIMRRSASGDEEKIVVNIRELLLQPDAAREFTLKRRDELFIPGLNGAGEETLLTSDPTEVIVVGQVGAPGVIKFAPGESATLMRAVFKAGGLTRFAKGDAIKLIRYSGQERTVELVDLEVVIEEGFLDRDRVLLPGDMVIVPQKFINL
ncbi:SLBB domain-containing protein [Coraliomargarita algicola]|uniref:SLBB domain-containing protein n=1 Tax=Coraliomargarita algicola TaxID=3092156 RepID=A0ABZ0RRL1_9BACT|nr:SLBB domain-containing protein [Coraliomargarita sp. J2-16]WPJ97733.1 SLBB domain-containing protein [Coraliomargarita sp. J2-16]